MLEVFHEINRDANLMVADIADEPDEIRHLACPVARAAEFTANVSLNAVFEKSLP
jgi:hypothetical protein